MLLSMHTELRPLKFIMTEKPVIIVGGGIAGLACGVTLVRHGIKPLLLERRPYLGGRACTQPTDPVLDNGPHLIAGAYKHLRRLLEITGTPLHFPPVPVPIRWFDETLREHSLQVGSRLRIIKSVFSNFGLSGISFINELNKLTSIPPTAYQNVAEWLQAKNFNPEIYRLLRLLVLSTMNTRPEEADFGLFCIVIKESLLSGADGSILHRFSPLETTLSNPLRDYFIQQGGVITLGSPVTQIVHQGDGWDVACGSKHFQAQHVVLSIPDHRRTSFINEPVYESSPIVTVRMTVSGIESGWFGFTKGAVHWVFVDDRTPCVLEALTSAKDEWISLEKDQIITEVINQIRAIYPNLIVEKVIGVSKEISATPKQTPVWNQNRQTPFTGFPGLWRAADDLATGLPATIESAAKAGIWAGLCITGKWMGKPEDVCSGSLDVLV